MGKIEDLENLQHLKESQIITDEEFEKEKEKIITLSNTPQDIINNNNDKVNQKIKLKEKKEKIICIIVVVCLFLIGLYGITKDQINEFITQHKFNSSITSSTNQERSQNKTIERRENNLGYVDSMVILGIIVIIVAIIIGIPLYFLPAIIAYNRKHSNKGTILLLDFLIGWTFLGWVGCLVWAFLDNDQNTTMSTPVNASNNKYEDIEKLMKLKESGALTEIEFEIEKQKLLR